MREGWVQGEAVMIDDEQMDECRYFGIRLVFKITFSDVNKGQGGGDGSSKQRQGWLRAYEKKKRLGVRISFLRVYRCRPCSCP